MHPFLFHNMGAGHGDKGLKTTLRTFSTRRHLAGVPQAAYVSVTTKNRVRTCPGSMFSALYRIWGT